MNIGTILMGVLPSIGVGALFFIAMRAIVRADRKERAAVAQFDAADAARARTITESAGDTAP